MDNRSIVFTKPKTAELLPCDYRLPGAGEVLTKLAVSTVSSGTERANLIGDPNVKLSESAAEAQFPRVLGYSSSGVVEAVGEGVTSVKPGDRVALSWSTHSKYCLSPEKNVHLIRDDAISFEEAALWHIASFPLAAIRKCRLEIGESAVVMGAGVLGLVAVKLLRAAGATPIVAVDPNPVRRDEALKAGADAAFDPFEADFAENVKALTGGAAVGIEVTGNGGGLNGILDVMRRFGRVALLGCTRNPNFTVDYYKKVHGPGITLVGAHTLARPETESSPGWWTLKDDVSAVQSLIHTHRLTLSDLVEETHAPQEAPSVYARLAEEASFPLVQFDWRKL